MACLQAKKHTGWTKRLPSTERAIGRFSDSSWFARVNALCILSRKKSREVAASLPDRFLRRRCFTLCITMEVEPGTAKQYKCHHCCSCKNYREKVMEGGRKVSLRRFLADEKIANSWKTNTFWGIL